MLHHPYSRRSLGTHRGTVVESAESVRGGRLGLGRLEIGDWRLESGRLEAGASVKPLGAGLVGVDAHWRQDGVSDDQSRKGAGIWRMGLDGRWMVDGGLDGGWDGGPEWTGRT